MPRRPTVLIVDDVPSEVVVLGEVLAPLCEVLFATSGVEGLELARRCLPDLVILDVVMPGLDGLEVCRSLKADPRLAPIPVIFLTVQMGEGEEYAGLRLGAVDYLAKPTPPALVEARVRNHLRAKALYEQQCALVAELRAALGAQTKARQASQCAWCRRVATDRGAWEAMLIPPNAAFTVCPDCLRELLA
ncbi:response regulator [Mesoterricola silvestris]|uniref:Response regulatory domain-containing protein n=1 Tax=Mesoterricola silvestris TaxID=2927979 RepID=A0AA48GMR8_9BACT|nr:response regulator [Mesoterricola silvestris]BDU70845.1 hypothetical protein METEAL_00190 [Mesoterricola silvestris]